MKVLVLAPHPDDESIGCGGSVCLHTQAGDSVVVVYLTSGEAGLKELPREEAGRIREAEAQRAGEVLGVQRHHFLRGTDGGQSQEVSRAAGALGMILQSEAPELIYLPHAGEWHPDHKAASPILREAMEGHSGLRLRLRAYEIWTPFSEFNHLENIDAVMGRKMLAIRAHRSQLQQLAYDRAIQGLNRYRGAFSTNYRYAEVFQESSLS